LTPEARAGVQTLLRRLADGDGSAVEPAFAALWPLLRRFSARALQHEADAEDAAQQALAKVFEQSARFDVERDGVAWVLTIVSFECRTLRRKSQRRREEALDAAAAVADGATPESLVVERDLEAAAREALGEMSDADARAIRTAISDARPARNATFRKRLQRALGRLRVAWRTKHEVE
jgi:RNA polymerase sigma-70 factor (ECF subfamily)